MDSQQAWEEHENENYRQQVFDGKLPRNVGDMSQEEYTWGSLPLMQRAAMMLYNASDQRALAQKLMLLDPLKRPRRAQDREIRAERIKQLLQGNNIPLREAPAPHYGLIEFNDANYQASAAWS